MAALSTSISKPAKGQMKLTPAGQNPVDSGLCIATHLDGSPCCERVAKFAGGWIPYCACHIAQGDPSLEAKKHPNFGMMCVALRKLPKGYLVGCYGEMVSTIDLAAEKLEWLWECEDGFGGLAGVDPKTDSGKGGQIQYALCVGRHEELNMRCLDDEKYCRCAMDGDGNALISSKSRRRYGTMYVESTRIIPAGYQLNTMYSDEAGTEEFFATRGIPRCDVWTEEHTTFLKRGCTKMDLETDPSTTKVRTMRKGKLLPHNSFQFDGRKTVPKPRQNCDSKAKLSGKTVLKKKAKNKKR